MRHLCLALLMVSGCEPVPATGGMFAPDLSGAVAPAGAVVPEGGYQLDGYKQEQTDADGGSDEDAEGAALYAELGAGDQDDFEQAGNDDKDVVAQSAEPSAAPAVVATVVQPGFQQVATAPWTPANAVRLAWGLRLLSTVNAATPPRAILGLPDGREEVVKAGDMLPDVGVVVLAVGHNVIQVGQVTAAGDHAKIESVFLQSMYPGQDLASP
jgi:hypothetical protein